MHPCRKAIGKSTVASNAESKLFIGVDLWIQFMNTVMCACTIVTPQNVWHQETSSIFYCPARRKWLPAGNTKGWWELNDWFCDMAARTGWKSSTSANHHAVYFQTQPRTHLPVWKQHELHLKYQYLSGVVSNTGSDNSRVENNKKIITVAKNFRSWRKTENDSTWPVLVLIGTTKLRAHVMTCNFWCNLIGRRCGFLPLRI